MIRAGITGAACVVLLAACGGSELVVQAQITDAEGQPVPLRGLPLSLLPYDRDAIFDSLGQAYAQPEPEIPPDLMTLRDSIAQAQTEWRNATERWNVGRDSLKTLSDRLRGMNPASGQYIVLFRDFNALEPQVNALQRTMDQSFQRFTELQNRTSARSNEVRLHREQWADAAYADVDRVIADRLKSLRLEEMADTTDDNGMARIRGARKGNWWLYARYDLPFEELYWNVPIQVTGGQVQVQLTPQNAQLRPKL
jgi:hypothetical protein